MYTNYLSAKTRREKTKRIFFLFANNTVLMNTIDRSPEIFEKKNSLLPHIRAYITALLLIAPSVDTQSETTDVTFATKQSSIVSSYQKKDISKETVEINEELLFKSAVVQAIRPINSLKSIPE